jgi:uncharacterized membrane protein
MTFIIIGLALIGLAAAAYGFVVEQKLKKNAAYQPFCNISERIKCTQALMSEYSTMFGIPNTLSGMIFYGIVIVLVLLGLVWPLFILCAAAFLISSRLAYILYFRIRTLCLICTTMYLVNISLVITTAFAVLRGGI